MGIVPLEHSNWIHGARVKVIASRLSCVSWDYHILLVDSKRGQRKHRIGY